jgi:hypothetical protein
MNVTKNDSSNVDWTEQAHDGLNGRIWTELRVPYYILTVGVLAPFIMHLKKQSCPTTRHGGTWGRVSIAPTHSRSLQ